MIIVFGLINLDFVVVVLWLLIVGEIVSGLDY